MKLNAIVLQLSLSPINEYVMRQKVFSDYRTKSSLAKVDKLAFEKVGILDLRQISPPE